MGWYKLIKSPSFKLLQGFKYLATVHKGWPATHENGHTDGLYNLLVCGARLQSVVHVKSDTAVAADGNGDAQSNKFFYLRA